MVLKLILSTSFPFLVVDVEQITLIYSPSILSLLPSRPLSVLLLPDAVNIVAGLSSASGTAQTVFPSSHVSERMSTV